VKRWQGLALPKRAVRKASDNAAAMAALAGARMLLVEDNDMNQELAMELLGQAGIEVVLANQRPGGARHAGARRRI
jgi:two-component system sensor histidine kinase/response regulator